jgi:thioredoxin reductase (NADPH)
VSRLVSNVSVPEPLIYDVVIVGAGPAGMAAALYTGRANLKTLLLDRMGAGGGQLLNTELIEDYPGFTSITGAALAQTFEDQIRRLGVEVTWGDVSGLEVRGNRRVVKTDDGTEYVAKAVILATGGLPRKLGVPGETELAGRGVSYCAICDGAFFKGKVLAVIGGGDSAIEEASFLTRYAEKVYIIHRGAQWRAQKVIQERALANPALIPIWHTTVEEIGGDGKVQWLRLKDVRTGDERSHEVGGVFIYVGFMPNSAWVGDALEKDDQGFLLTDQKMETTVTGVYVSGDLRSQYVRQIANAAGDATTAAVAATRYIQSLEATANATAAEPVERVLDLASRTRTPPKRTAAKAACVASSSRRHVVPS